jgi:hypothetical protein
MHGQMDGLLKLVDSNQKILKDPLIRKDPNA